MKYEMYLKLKEAGFPQDIFGMRRTCPCDYFTVEEQGSWICTCKYEEKIARPDLASLIAFCGDNFDSLGLRTGYNHDAYRKWAANGLIERESSGFKQIKVQGDTPEEAVANLWLVINKK